MRSAGHCVIVIVVIIIIFLLLERKFKQKKKQTAAFCRFVCVLKKKKPETKRRQTNWNSLYDLLSVFYYHPRRHCESRLGLLPFFLIYEGTLRRF